MTEATATTQPAAMANITDVLRNRNFLFLWLAQLLSQTAQQMINYVLLQQAYALSNGSSTAVSGIIIAFTLPAIVFSAIAGVFVDRQPKRRVLIITNVGRGLTMLAYLFLTGHQFALGALTVLYLTTLVFASVSQFFVPAEGAAIPLLVKRDQLIAANSLFNLTFTGSQLVGFLILGPLFVKLLVRDNDYGPVYIPLFILYMGCALLTWFLPKNEQIAASDSADASVRARINTAVAELKEGWSYIRVDGSIFGAIIQWSVAIAVLMMLGVIGPGFLKIELGIDPQDLYIILVPGGIGLVAGVVLVSRFATEENRLRMINYAMVAAGVGLLIFAGIGWTIRFVTGLLYPAASSDVVRSLASPWLIGAMMILTLLLGALNSFVSVPAQTTLQERAREDIRARVFSAFYTISNVILVVPLIFAGTLADLIGVVATVALIGVAVLVVAYWGIRRGLVAPPPLTVPNTTRQPLIVPTSDMLQSSAGTVAHQTATTPLSTSDAATIPLPSPAPPKNGAGHEPVSTRPGEGRGSE